MSNTKFIIKQIFKIEAREMIVLSGDLLSGNILDDMYVVHSEKNLFVKINSIESVNSKVASIGLTFISVKESEFDNLLALKIDDIVDLVTENIGANCRSDP